MRLLGVKLVSEGKSWTFTEGDWEEGRSMSRDTPSMGMGGWIGDTCEPFSTESDLEGEEGSWDKI